jgi:hypothetical protein
MVYERVKRVNLWKQCAAGSHRRSDYAMLHVFVSG